jgi:hypothetical protein
MCCPALVPNSLLLPRVDGLHLPVQLLQCCIGGRELLLRLKQSRLQATWTKSSTHIHTVNLLLCRYMVQAAAVNNP